MLGDEHVDGAIERTTPFTEDFQDLITRYAWGEIWTRPGLDRRTRSCITLAALVASGREHELALHVRAALRNGLTPDEICEVLLQCAVYCGVPAANSAFAIAQRVLDEDGVVVTRAVVLSAVRTPVGRYGGGLAASGPTTSRRSRSLRRSSAPACLRARSRTSGSAARTRRARTTGTSRGSRRSSRGCPESVAGVTVNRLCASGLSAVVGACHAVIAGDGDLFVAGGVESMTRAPLVTAKPDAPYARGNRTIYDRTLGWRFTNPRYEERFSSESMGETGENVAERWAVSREDQDAFALRSQQRWAEADAARALRRRARRRRRARARRASAPRHDGREACVAEAGVPRRGHGDGRERERDQRRRGGARHRERGARAVARRRAARSVRRLGGRGRRPGGHGHRAGARRPQAARADRTSRSATSTSSS